MSHNTRTTLGARAVTMPSKVRLAERRRAAALHPAAAVERPSKREECRGGARPCPFVSCRHHLYLDVNPVNGTIKLNQPELEPWEMEQSCALDVADEGPHSLDATGVVLNLTRERVQQIEVRALLGIKPDLED